MKFVRSIKKRLVNGKENLKFLSKFQTLHALECILKLSYKKPNKLYLLSSDILKTLRWLRFDP